MSKKEMSVMDWIVFVLIIIGGLNWGLAVFDFNLVAWIFGTGVFTKIIYALIGISTVYALIEKLKK